MGRSLKVLKLSQDSFRDQSGLNITEGHWEIFGIFPNAHFKISSIYVSCALTAQEQLLADFNGMKLGDFAGLFEDCHF